MAEDQGVNGENWNKEAAKLLKLIGWTKVGDSNIDIKGANDKSYGIDQMQICQYENDRKSKGVFIEAKKYKPKSYSASLLNSWVWTLNTKINQLKYSPELNEKFPTFAKANLGYGVIFIWIKEYIDYINSKVDIYNDLEKIKNTHGIEKNQNRIFVLENKSILKLLSLVEMIQELSNKYKNDVFFLYPAKEYVDSSVSYRSKSLSLENIMSPYILAETKDNNNDDVIILFYFGKCELYHFKLLRSFLKNSGNLVEYKKLIIYLYDVDMDEYRKIDPDAKKLFQVKDITISPMKKFTDLHYLNDSNE